MSELFLMYIWLKLDALQVLLGLTGFLLCMYVIFCCIEHTGYEGDLLRQIKKPATCALIALISAFATPSTKQATYLLAGHLAIKAYDSDVGKALRTRLEYEVIEQLELPKEPKQQEIKK